MNLKYCDSCRRMMNRDTGTIKTSPDNTRYRWLCKTCVENGHDISFEKTNKTRDAEQGAKPVKKTANDIQTASPKHECSCRDSK